MSDLKTLLTQGFELVGGESPRRLLIGSQSKERCGKTHWAVKTMPKPLAYIGIDFGHEGVIEKFASIVSGEEIIKFIINVPPVTEQSQYLAVWSKLNIAIQAAMRHPNVRSVVLDTGTDIWELLRLAEFGSLTKSGDVKHLYNVINQAYRSLIRMAYDREINLCVLHKVKKFYQVRQVMTSKGKQDQEYWDGVSYERAGFGEGGFLIQVQIEHLYDSSVKDIEGTTLEDRFGLRVLDCRQNMAIEGLELWGKDCTFPKLAVAVFPDTSESDWK